MLLSLITAVHLFVCILLIIIVLLQQGRGADMGATFGGGGNTLFGASGADNLLSRVTAFCAAIFMVTSVYLAVSMKPGVANAGRLEGIIPTSTNVQTLPQEIPQDTVPLNAPSDTGPAAETAPIEGAATGAVVPPSAPSEPVAASPAAAPEAAPVAPVVPAAPVNAAPSAPAAATTK